MPKSPLLAVMLSLAALANLPAAEPAAAAAATMARLCSKDTPNGFSHKTGFPKAKAAMAMS